MSALKPVMALNADELFAMALAADANGNKTQAYMICLQIAAFAPSHPGIRQFLNHVSFDGQWITFDSAVSKIKSMLEAGKLELLLTSLLPELIAQSNTSERRMIAVDLLGQAQVQVGQFQQARKTYADLSVITPAPASYKFSAIAKLLLDNPDGMYLLKEPYPGAAMLYKNIRFLAPGPVSLKDSLAFEAAIHEKAIEAMADAIRLIPSARKDQQFFHAAMEGFAKADAICPDISLSYRIELATTRASELRSQAQFDLKSFNTAIESLGKSPMNASAFHGMIMNLLTNLDGISGKLDLAMETIKPYAKESSELVDQINRDISGLAAVRSTLKAELHD